MRYELAVWSNLAVAAAWLALPAWSFFAVGFSWTLVLYGVWPLSLLFGSLLFMRERVTVPAAILCATGSIAFCVLAICDVIRADIDLDRKSVV